MKHSDGFGGHILKIFRKLISSIRPTAVIFKCTQFSKILYEILTHIHGMEFWIKEFFFLFNLPRARSVILKLWYASESWFLV